MADQTVVISDLLSFLACKVKQISREILMNTLKSYYSPKEISEAYEAFFTSLPEFMATKYKLSPKNLDSLTTLYNCFQVIPTGELPIFVCKNLNNIPELDTIKLEQINEEIDDDDDEEEEEDLESNDYGIEKTLREEQQTMKTQIADIALVVKQLKTQLDNISQQSQFKSKTNSQIKCKRKVNNPSNFQPTKKVTSETEFFTPKKDLPRFKKKSLKYLQSLIDEDEDERIDGDKSEKDVDSDYQLDSEFEEFIQKKKEEISCQVVLKEEPEDIDLIYNRIDVKKENEIYLASPSKGDQLENYFGDEGSPSKTTSQKVIYIKNMENRDIWEDDEENSIEIASSSDYLEEDPLSRIPFELSGEEDFKGEIELMVDEKNVIKVVEEESHVCSVCEETFRSQKKLKIHAKSHCVKKNFDCMLCDEGFQTNELLEEHYKLCLEIIKKKYNLDSYPCPTCGRLYGQERALKQHSYVHSQSRPFPCNKCTYRYLTKNALQAHIKTQHNELNKYFCPFCDNSYISSGFLKNHLRSHTGERPYACKDCGYKGSTPDLLKRHMLTHGPPQEYKCELCEFTCLGIGKLSRHKAKEHKKENIFCTLCGKEFNNSCVYHRHYMSHVGERPFRCTVCTYAAISKEVLFVHMRTHTGDNIIHCPNCRVPFGTNYSLKRHLKNYCVNNRSAGYFDAEFVVSGTI